jgi:hypothetical protein
MRNRNEIIPRRFTRSSGSASGDGRALNVDLSNAMDSRITFSRSSNATYVDPNGFLAWGDTNLVRDSIGFAVSGATSRGWGTNGTVSLVTDRNGVSSNASRASYTQSGSVSVTWSPDVGASVSAGSVIRFWIRGVTNAARIDVGWYQSTLGWGSASDGSCAVVGGYSSGVTITSQNGVLFKVENLSTTEWTQLEVKRFTRADYFGMYFGGASATGLIHAFEFSDFQAHPGTVARPFVATSNAGTGGLQAGRIDYDPSTGSPRGLLLEGPSTNLILWSELFSTASWGIAGLNGADTTASTSVANPRNVNVVRRFAEDTTFTSHGMFQSVATTSGQPYTLSAFVKGDGTRNFATLRITMSGGNPSYTACWSLVDGSKGGTNTVGSPTGVKVWDAVKYPNGWWRIALTMNAPASATLCYLNASDRSNIDTGPQAYTGAGSSVGIYAFGLQMERGLAATSYVPTVNSTVTRAADSATITGTSFSSWFSHTNAGTFYVQGDRTMALTSGYPRIAVFTTSDQWGNPNFSLLFDASNSRIGANYTVSTNGDLADLGVTSAVPGDGSPFRAAFAFAGANSRLSLGIGGTQYTSDETTKSPTLPTSGYTTLWLTRDTASLSMSTHIRGIAYWPTRLSNGALQQLVTG